MSRLTSLSPAPGRSGTHLAKRLTAIIAVAAALAATAPPSAEACSNAVTEADETVAGFKEAERLLNDGNPWKARSRIIGLLEELGAHERTGAIGTESGLRARGARVLALADVRLDPVGHATGKRRAVLEKAASELQRLADESPNDPAKQTDLGEALARTKPIAAKEILEDLAGRDLVTTPYGYVALARLRAADGDVKGRDVALARCELMAKTSSICRIEPPWFTLAMVMHPYALGAVVLAALGALAVALRRRSGRPLDASRALPSAPSSVG